MGLLNRLLESNIKSGKSMDKSLNSKLLLGTDEKGELISHDLVDTLINMHDKEIQGEGRGRCFELFLGDLFRISGYEVEVTQLRRDGGVDLYVRKDGNTFVIQAKKCKLGLTGINGVREVRELGGVLKPGEKGVFITLNYFSPDAKAYAEEYGIELIDKEKLIMLIAQLQPMLLAKAYYEKIIEDFPRCPKCGSVMVKKNGRFWGCVNYPECRGKRVLE